MLSIPQVRTNYGKFNIRFIGPKMWNLVNKLLKQHLVDCLLKMNYNEK